MTSAERMRRYRAKIKREQPDPKTAAKKARRAEREAELGAKIKALPNKTYGLVMPDPPWRFEFYSRETGMDRAPDNHYATTVTAALVEHCPNMAKDSGCFMWATVPMLEQAMWLLRQWEFDYKSEWLWRKVYPGQQTGTGFWGRNVHEILLIGTRGDFPAPAPGQQPLSVIEAPVGAHSAKPAVFYEIIDRLYPAFPSWRCMAGRRDRDGMYGAPKRREASSHDRQRPTTDRRRIGGMNMHLDNSLPRIGSASAKSLAHKHVAKIGAIGAARLNVDEPDDDDLARILHRVGWLDGPTLIAPPDVVKPGQAKSWLVAELRVEP